MVGVHPARWCTSPLGVVPAGLGDGVGDCHDVTNLPRVCFLFPFCIFFFEKTLLYFQEYDFRFLFGKQKDFFFFWEVILWMFHIGRARHPGPGPRSFIPGQMSVEFVNVGGWLTCGDLALDSCAQFLAVAEHRLIPSGARSICHQLWKAGYQSVRPPACQDQVAGGGWCFSRGGARVALPTFATSEFKEYFRLGRALRVTFPTGNEEVGGGGGLRKAAAH